MFKLDKTTVAQSFDSTNNNLEGNKIHVVNVKGITKATGEGPNGKWNAVDFEFVGEEGKVFKHRVFEPSAKNEDHVRKMSQFGPNPSRVDEIVTFIRHFIAAVHPNLDKQIDEKGFNFKSWTELTDFLIKLSAKVEGVSTKIKLFKDSRGYAIFPRYYLSISRAGELYMRTSFIGDKLETFNDWDIKQIDKQVIAKPTTMASPSGGSTLNLMDDSDDSAVKGSEFEPVRKAEDEFDLDLDI